MTDKGYIKSLDGVRAIAILLVMTFHAQLTDFGWMGVQLFFVLSGFLITGILWKEKDRTDETLGYKFRKFWVRRSLRIFPLYYGYIAVISIAYLLFHFPPYFEAFFPYLITYTANFPLRLIQEIGNPLFNHLWSLSIEEQFYLLFPLILLLAPKNFSRKMLIAIIFLSPVARYLVGEYYKGQGLPALYVANGVNFNTLCQLDAFCFGGIIHTMSLHTRITRPFRLFLGILLVVFGAGVISYIFSDSKLSYWFELGYYHYLIDNYQHVWHYTLLNILSASFVLLMVNEHTKRRFITLRKILENRWMVRVGKVSYGMYMFHWLIWIYVFYDYFRPYSYSMKLLLFVPYVLLVYVLAELSYRLFENPFIKLKDKFFPAGSQKVRKSVSPKEV